MTNVNNTINCIKCKQTISSNKIQNEKHKEITIKQEKVLNVRINKCLVTKCMICDNLIGVYNKSYKTFTIFKNAIEYRELTLNKQNEH